MNDGQHPRNELPDSLGKIVAGIVAEPAPDDLKDEVRSRLRNHFKPQRASAKWYTAAAVATSIVAATVAAVLLLGPANIGPVTDVGSGDGVVVSPPADVPVEGPSADSPSFEGPSLWAYHRAANDSLDRLDGLLAEHAAVVLTSSPLHHTSNPSLPTSRYLEEYK